MATERPELIVGASSRVAQQYLKHCDELGRKVVLVSRREIKPQNNTSISDVVQQDLTDTNLAALKEAIRTKDLSRVVYFAVTNIDCASQSIEELRSVNTDPIPLICEQLSANGSLQFVYFSTDMVFNSNAKGHDEDSEDFSDWNGYASSKRSGEKETLSYEQGQVVRLGNVVGVNNDFLSRVAQALKEGKPVNAWTNTFNRFACMSDICAVLDALEDYQGEQRIFHVASADDSMSRYDIASAFVNLCERQGVLPQNTSKSVGKSKANLDDGRPQYLVLNTTATRSELGVLPTQTITFLGNNIDFYRD
ncbi:MAG: sugar nucleotide-binding protein [Candidatus Nanoarchaeia archaeon]